jgi:hypothetical protein
MQLGMIGLGRMGALGWTALMASLLFDYGGRQENA